MSRIPIKDLKELANKNGQDIVIMFGADTDGHTTHVATWGRSIELCDRAAMWGNNMKKQLGWPESLTHAEPSRVRKLQAKIKELEALIAHKVNEAREQFGNTEQLVLDGKIDELNKLLDYDEAKVYRQIEYRLAKLKTDTKEDNQL